MAVRQREREWEWVRVREKWKRGTQVFARKKEKEWGERGERGRRGVRESFKRLLDRKRERMRVWVKKTINVSKCLIKMGRGE